MTAARIVDLSSLTPSAGFIIQGDAAGDRAGWSVSSAGDVNGDGIDDLIVGAPFGDDGGTDAGEAYVIYGVTGSARGTVDLTNLVASDGFVIQGDLAGDLAGISVSSAGDVNGDGIDDVIVGALYSDLGGEKSGEAYVIYGVAGATRANLDLTGLSSSDGFTIQGDESWAIIGLDVSSAGDVNGDGIDDVIVGSRGNSDGWNSGEAYVIYGVAGGRASLDLNNLAASDGFMIQGDVAYDYAGNSVSSAGDVNGDGLDDLIVAAYHGNDGGSRAGEAYVIYGVAGATRGTVDLTGLSPSDGFIIQGDAAGDWTGSGVSSAGDVNGDGINDLIVGAYLSDVGGVDSGQAYVIYGKTGAIRGTLDLTGLSANDGFAIQGDAAGDWVGRSVSSAGDLNGDGLADVIVGAPGADGGGVDAGAAYVIYGKAGFARGTVDLTALSASDGFIIQGDTAGDLAGPAVSTAGDVNGDGIDDLIVGAQFGDDGGTDAGEAYVILGGSVSGFGEVVDLTGLAKPFGFVIQGDAAGDHVGYSVSSAGDVNGDGIDDLIVGARYGDDGGIDAGEAYVIYGKAGFTRGIIDLTGLAASDGFIIQGDAAGAGAGWSVSAAGDVNGDGTADLIVGVPGGDGGGQDSGQAYVIYGQSGSSRGLVDLAGLNSSDGFIIIGDSFDDRAGWSVSSAGDVNGDGIDDVIFGAKYGDDGESDAGEAYVIYGVTGGPSGYVDLTSLSPLVGFIIQGDSRFDQAGYSVSSAGDVNGDGFDDLIVGARFNDFGGLDAGAAYVVYGMAGHARSTVDLTGLATSDGFIIQGDASYDWAGQSVSSAGDVNGDGIDDVIVGALRGDNGGFDAGEAYVIYGKAGSTRGTVDLTGLATSDGFVIQGDASGDFAGVGVSSAGDVNGDGIDDLIVGADQNDSGGIDAGAAYVIFGKAGHTRSVIDLTALAASDGFKIQGDAAGDFAGRSVSAAGDVNGDGIDDLIVGASRGDDGGINAGEAYVIYGRLPTTAVERIGTSLSDNIFGGALNDTIRGLGGNDRIDGGDGADSLFGGNGADSLIGGLGADTMIGGKGNDTYTVDSVSDVVTEALNAGNDTVQTTLASYALGPNVENLVELGSAASTLIGNALANRITGNIGNDSLDGGSGNDALTSRGGNDILDGGAGADTMIGGKGNDTYMVDSVTDSVVEAVNSGTDTVRTTLSNYSLGANVENLTALGNGAFNGVGNELNNTIVGNIGNDQIAGMGGNDTLTGGLGNDAFVFNTVPSPTNRDYITDFNIGNDTIFLVNVGSGLFDALPLGALAASAFKFLSPTGGAVDADDRIILHDYGGLFYDVDGSGAAVAIQFAMINMALSPAIDHTDFYVT